MGERNREKKETGKRGKTRERERERNRIEKRGNESD